MSAARRSKLISAVNNAVSTILTRLHGSVATSRHLSFRAESLESRILFGWVAGYNIDETPAPFLPSGGGVYSSPGGPDGDNHGGDNNNNNNDKCGCDNNGPAFTSQPVRAFDGLPEITTSDLQSTSFGFSFGITRSWTGLNNSGPLGNGWSIEELPYVVVGGEAGSYYGLTLAGTYPEDRISLVAGGTVGATFTVPPTSGGQYNTFAQWGPAPGALRLDTIQGTPTTLRLTDERGNVTDFYDVYRSGNQPLPHTLGDATQLYGRFKDFTSADGQVKVTASYSNVGGKYQLTSLTRNDLVSGSNEQLLFNYGSNVTNSLGGSAPLVRSIQWQRQASSMAPWQTIRTALYTYYCGDGKDSDGNNVNVNDGRLGDLEKVTIQDANGNTINRRYYRYYKFTGEAYGVTSQGPTNNANTTGGPAPYQPSFEPGAVNWNVDGLIFSGLKTVVEDASFDRMAAAIPNYQTAPDEGTGSIEPYVDHYFKYERWDDHIGADGQAKDQYNNLLGSAGYNNANVWSFMEAYRMGTRYRVTQEVARAAGASSPGGQGGQGTYKLEYAANYNSDGPSNDPNNPGGMGFMSLDYNIWRMKQTEYLADSTPSTWADNDRQITYMNEVGQPMLKVFVHVGGTPVTIMGMAVSNASTSGATVTVTANNTFQVGDYVAISGVLPELYNGVFKVTSIDTVNHSYFTFTLPYTYFGRDFNGNVVAPPPYANTTTPAPGAVSVGGAATKVLSQWETYYRYDDSGHLIETAQPSAVTGYDDSQPDLVDSGGVALGLISATSGLVNTYHYPGWEFTGQAGITANGSVIAGGGQAAYAGTEAGFIQTNGTISQSVVATSSGTCTLNFAAGDNVIGSGEYLEVLLDGVPQSVSINGIVVGTAFGVGQGYGYPYSAQLTLTPGLHLIEFVGEPNGNYPGDALFIDNVSLTGPGLSDGGFESLGLSYGTYKYCPEDYALTATATSGGTTVGQMDASYVQQGQQGVPLLQESVNYYANTNGSVGVFPVASDTAYGAVDPASGATSDPRTTTYSYSFFSGTNQIESQTTTLPTVSVAQNGPGTPDIQSTTFDQYGNPISTVDGDGYTNQTQYDMVNGGVSGQVTDVGHLNLTTSIVLDPLGRPIKETEPDGSVTWTVYNDANHETRVYKGWTTVSGSATTSGATNTLTDTAHLTGPAGSYIGYTLLVTGGTDINQTATVTGYNPATKTITFYPPVTSATSPTAASGYVLGGTTGAIQINREYRPTAGAPLGQQTVYEETITSSAAPAIAVVNSVVQPTGLEVINASNIQSLSRSLTNAGGQVYETDNYVSLSGVSYTTASAYLGAPLRIDGTDQGTWRGVYGGDGYDLLNYSASLPSYATVTPSGQSSFTWYSSTTDPRALQKPSPATDRVAACWCSSTSFTVNVNLTDGNTHQVALYFVDFDTQNRSERVDLTNLTTGALISSQTVSNFGQGEYFVYNLSGNVQFTITNLSGSLNAVLSGIFFDPAQSTNYYPTYLGYDSRGRENRTADPNGTITRMVFDGLSRVTSKWVGTNDIGATDANPAGGGSPNNMVDVEDNQYDNGGVGDSTLTQVTDHVGGGNADHVTLDLYDFRDRLIATKQGALIVSGAPDLTDETNANYTVNGVYINQPTVHRPIKYSWLGNLGETLGTYTYDGDGVNLNDFAGGGQPSADPGKLRSETLNSYDDQGRVYLSKQYSVDYSGNVTTSLNTNSFYDHRGNTIEGSDPGGLVTKHQYDGAGRDVRDTTSDGGIVNGAAQTWANAGNISNDVVLEQTDTAYDPNGNAIWATQRQRFDDAPQIGVGGMGPLGYPSSDYSAALAAYAFNEGSGTNTVDASGQGHTGTLVGGVTWTPSGHSGSALVFNGTTGYVDIGNPSALNFTGPITISAWVKPTSTSGLQDIVAHGYTTSPNAEVFLRINNGNYEVGSWNGTVYSAFAAIPGADAGNWVNLVGEYDGSSWKLYDNGVVLASAAASVGAVQVGADWTIGAAAPGDGRFFNGSIDDVRLFGRGLTAQEISALAASAPGARVSYSGMYYDAADRATDTVNVGTNQGSPWNMPASVPVRSDTALVTSTGYKADEVLTISATGSFTLTFEGQTTGSLPANSTAAQVQSALQGLSTIGTNNVLVTGPTSGPWTIRFTNGLAEENLTPITASGATVTIANVGGDGGRQQKTAESRGVVNKTDMDLLGRTTQTIAAFDGLAATALTDQTTAYTYDGNGDALTMTAVQPTTTPNQTTAYVYGVGGTIGTNIFSNNLIQKVEYPIKTGAGAGQPDTTNAYDQQSFAYDFLGEKTSFTDQNGNTHSYNYDVLGRLTADIITALGSGVNGTVRRLGFSFDSAGRPYQQTSYSNITGATTLNQVQDAYNGYGQLTTEYQEHVGAVNMSTSKNVQYGYSQPSGANYSRLTSVTDPNGRTVDYLYGGTEPVTSISSSNLTATVTTASPHGLVVGSQVTIQGASPSAFDGTYTVATVVSSTQFTYTFGGNSNNPAAGTDISAIASQQLPITAITFLGTTATATTASTTGLSVGMAITIQGATPTIYDGSFTVASIVDSTHFTYTLSGTPTSNASGADMLAVLSTATTLDGTISRLTSMQDHKDGTILEAYQYLGLGTIVQKDRPQSGVDLSYIQQYQDPNPPPTVVGTGGDRYTGLDAFGRVIDQNWTNPSSGSSGTVDRFQYGYDRKSNALYRNNIVNLTFGEMYHANAQSSGDNNTAYDPLGRLTNFQRGTLVVSTQNYNGGVLDTVNPLNSTSGVPNTNSWNLDALGNWTGGSQNRTFNAQNQITAMTGFTTPTYDNNGNMKKDEAGNTYQYDAWNRLVWVTAGSTTEYYSYDADNRRPGLSICAGAVTNSYYSTNWQDLEDDVYNPCGGSTTVSTYEWGLSYIDDLIARDQNVNGGAITRIYAQQDANHDVTALVNTSGAVLERFIYDPYGSMKVLNASTWATRSDGYSWVYTFQGGRYDPVSGKINFRNRDLDPVTGTWMQQDPAGYADSANLYEFVQDSPVGLVDPRGLGPMRPKATLPGPWHDVIGGPLEALDNFQSRHGGTAKLSDALIDALRQYDFYQNLLNEIKKKANGVPCDARAHEFSGSNQDVLTSPVQLAEGGLPIQQLPGFDPQHPPTFAAEPNYSFLLNTALGTIHSLAWTATAYRSEQSDGCCKVKSLKVDFQLRKTYAFVGAGNAMLSWIPGKPYVISNDWREVIIEPGWDPLL